MAWRTVTRCSRNVWVTNTSESQNSVPVLPHGLGHTSELRGCNACLSPYLVPPLKKNSCYCSNDAMLQDCLCCVPREPQAQWPCQEPLLSQPAWDLHQNLLQVGCLLTSPFICTKGEGNAGNEQLQSQGKSLGTVSTWKNFLEISSHSAPSYGFSWRRGQPGPLFI